MNWLEHDVITAFAKSWGLLYLFVLAMGALAYALWPANGKRFEQARLSIMDDENGPWD